jgi:hypothetical protein
MSVGSRFAVVLTSAALMSSGCVAFLGQAGSAAVRGAFSPLWSPEETYVASDSSERPLAVSELHLASDGVRAMAVIRTEHPVLLRRVSLAADTSPPCHAGWAADVLALEGQRRWDRPVGVEGTRALTLYFSPPRSFLRGPLQLEALFEEGAHYRCIRVSVGGGPDSQPLTRKSRRTDGGGLGIARGTPALANTDVFADRDGNRLGLLMAGSVGVWLGHWRLAGQLEACMFACGREIISVPVVATIDRLVYVGRSVAWAGRLGYQLGRGEDLLASFSEHPSWIQGPQIGLMLLGPRPVAGADTTEGFAARGFGVFLQRQFRTIDQTTNGVGTSVWVFGLQAVAI